MNASDGRITILAIDDDQAALTQITTIAEAAGYQCHCATDAATAEQAVRETTPDLIIANINLAGHSGLAVCEQLKRQAEMPGVPVMFLSAGQGPDIIRRAHAAGGSYYLRKPFDAPVLLQMMEQARFVAHLAHV